MIDLFQSRRNYPLYCKFWSTKNNIEETEEIEEVKENIKKQQSLTRKRMQDGSFFAKLENEIKEENSAIAGVALVEKTNITISTPDLKKDELKNNDLVVIGEEEYFVEHIDRKIFNQLQLEFGEMKNVSYITFISLRK